MRRDETVYHLHGNHSLYFHPNFPTSRLFVARYILLRLNVNVNNVSDSEMLATVSISSDESAKNTFYFSDSRRCSNAAAALQSLSGSH